MSRESKPLAHQSGSAGGKGLPLAGIRVLDFTHAAAGPFATMLLADLGAEIIKIERATSGDGSRTMGQPMPGFPPKNSDYYLSLNRNKRSVALDLAQPEGVAIAQELVERCDVVVENFRPKVMDRLGLGFEQLKARRPGLIYCSISAFGREGPWSDLPANDIIMQSVSGLMAITGEVGGGPVRIGAPISDFSSGLFGLSGILAALVARERHPEGQHIEVAMLDASLNMMCNYIPSVAGLGASVPRLGRGHAQIVPYQAFSCEDGEFVMVGAFTRNFWLNLCRALGREDWATDPRFRTNAARLKHRAILIGELEAIFQTRPRDAWVALLQESDVPCSPVLELHDAVLTEQVRASGSIRAMRDEEHDVKVARSPIRVAEWDEEPCAMAPDIGRDSAQVLGELLGLSEGALARLAETGSVGLGAKAPARHDTPVAAE